MGERMADKKEKKQEAVPAGHHMMPETGMVMKDSDMPGMTKKKKPSAYQMVERGLAEYRKKEKQPK